MTMTNKEAISNLERIYGIVSPDIQISLDLAVKALEKRPTGEWESLGFVNMKYAWCRCSNCHKTTKIYKDSSNEFCCIADIRKKAVACLYCGAKMKGEEE